MLKFKSRCKEGECKKWDRLQKGWIKSDNGGFLKVCQIQDAYSPSENGILDKVLGTEGSVLDKFGRFSKIVA